MTRINLVALAIAAMALLGCSAAPREADDQVEIDAGQIACPEVAIEPVPAVVIEDAYEANEAAAQKKYGGQCVLVAGEIGSVDLDASDKPVIHLASEHLIGPSIELLDARADQAVNLKKGQKALFMCNKVSEFMGVPTLDGCFVSDGQGRAVP